MNVTSERNGSEVKSRKNPFLSGNSVERQTGTLGGACAVGLFFIPTVGHGRTGRPRAQGREAGDRRGRIPARHHGTVRALAAEGRLLSFACDFL